MYMKKKVLYIILLTILILIVVALYDRSPKTSNELYEYKCSYCHDLPDLSSYKLKEIEPLVNFMRHHNGAKRVISDDESIIIIRHITNTQI